MTPIKMKRSKKKTKKRVQRGYQKYHKRDSLLHRSHREDRRRERDIYQGYLLDDGRPAEYVDFGDERFAGKHYSDGRIAFKDPRKTVVCQKRKERREALFRANKVGKGKKVSKKRIRTEDSDIICRRR